MTCIKCRAALPSGAIYCPLCGKKQVKEQRKALKRPNGMGTVYKLQGRRRRPWVAAKNKTIVGYYEKKTDALEALERLAGKEITERYNMTFAEVFSEWSAEHYPTLTKAGCDQYDGAYKVFSPLYGCVFRSLRTKDFQAVIDQHFSKSNSTVSKYKQLLTQMSQWALREELITTNFASFVRVPERVKKEKETFSEEDIKKLEVNGSETAKIILMLIGTGMRIGELFALTLDDFHGDYVIGGEKTEAGRNRVIPIRPEAKPYFAYFVRNATDQQLLSGYVGDKVPANFRKRNYYPLLEKLGIEKKSPHSTRHTYASRARREGMPPEILQKILGHANYTTTAEIYVHKDIEELLAAVNPQTVSKKP